MHVGVTCAHVAFKWATAGEIPFGDCYIDSFSQPWGIEPGIMQSPCLCMSVSQTLSSRPLCDKIADASGTVVDTLGEWLTCTYTNIRCCTTRLNARYPICTVDEGVDRPPASLDQDSFSRSCYKAFG